jgi:hypothetical protein
MTVTHADPFAQPSELATTNLDDELIVRGQYRLALPPEGYKSTTGHKLFTRTTTFAKSIEDTYNLGLWHQRNLAYGLVMRPDILAQIAALGAPNDANKAKFMEFIDQAREAAGSSIGANLGTALHAFADEIDKGMHPVIPPAWRKHLASYTELFEKYGLEVVESEQIVLNTVFDVAGRFDRLVRLTRDLTFFVDGQTVVLPAGSIVVLDLKTASKDVTYGALGISVQLVIYADARWIYDPETRTYREMPQGVHPDYALVVHLPSQGENAGEADLYMVNINKGRIIAGLCKDVRNARKMKGLMTKVAVVEANPSPEAALHVVGPAPLRLVEPPTLVDRIATADRAGLDAIWVEAMRTRQDNGVVKSAIAARLKEL